MSNEINVDLPYFSYGFFRPGEISFLGIKDFVLTVQPITIDGDLVLKDVLSIVFSSHLNSRFGSNESIKE